MSTHLISPQTIWDAIEELLKTVSHHAKPADQVPFEPKNDAEPFTTALVPLSASTESDKKDGLVLARTDPVRD